MKDLSAKVEAAWKNVSAILERLGGCKIKQVSLPHTRYSIVCYHVLGECEISSNMARYDGLEYGRNFCFYGLNQKLLTCNTSSYHKSIFIT